MPVGNPPTTEKGALSPDVGLMMWASIIDEREYVPELKFPISVDVYERMETDAQCSGLLAGTILTLKRFRFRLDRNGARPEVVEKISKDYGLQIRGEDPGNIGRRKGRFSWPKHLHHLLRALVYGFYYFEQVGEVDEAKYGDSFWHVRKLAPRPAYTIAEIMSEKDGGLKGIKQNTVMAPTLGVPTIPVDNLLAYVWNQEAGNWFGKSMLRGCYKNWFLKDRLLRIDAMKHERGGIGTPVIEAPADATDAELKKYQEMAQAFRAHEMGGGAIPQGAKLTLQGTQGTLPDTIGSARFHNEEMARNFLMMFFQLGQTETGSRALGEQFIDFFAYAQESIADWICDTFNEHQIEDDVDWNWGEDEQSPILTYARAEDEEIPYGDLAVLVEKGLVVVDDELENIIRQRAKLPPKPEPEETPEPPAPPVEEPPVEEPPPPEPSSGGSATAAAGGGRRSVRAATVPPLSLPPRDLRRQPYPHEVQAAVDFALIDSNITSAIAQLVGEVSVLQQAQINDLHDQIVAAEGNLQSLATLKADTVSEEAILGRMRGVADQGVEQAMGEAQRQGKTTITKPAVSEYEALIAARAKAVDEVLATSLSEAASRQALSRTGGSLTAAEVAGQVRTHLSGLTDAYLKDQLGGTLTQAMNTGRRGVMRLNNPVHIYASELLDTATCSNCIAKDGTQYLNLGDAERDYPTGGLADCKGGPRCRGTLVAVYEEAEATLEEPGT